MNQIYLDTAKLLTQVAPLAFADGVFALKGGTAINLFVREMPRLSVDLDLVFPDYTLPREEALVRINQAIRNSAERLTARGFLTRAIASGDAGETKLLVRRANVELKAPYTAALTCHCTDTGPVDALSGAVYPLSYTLAHLPNDSENGRR
jgi:hypothetical protein